MFFNFVANCSMFGLQCGDMPQVLLRRCVLCCYFLEKQSLFLAYAGEWLPSKISEKKLYLCTRKTLKTQIMNIKQAKDDCIEKVLASCCAEPIACNVVETLVVIFFR